MNRERDVNYLLHRQQVSLICARTTHSVKGRAAYEDLARGYTDQVDPYRRHNEKLIVRAH